MNYLIDDELAKLQIKVSTREEVEVSDERVQKELEAERQRYPDKKVFDELAERAHWSGEKEQEMRLAARIQRGDHLERMVELSIAEADVRSWFEAHRDDFPGSYDDHRAAIYDALLVMRKDAEWKEFRVARLRRYAEGKIDLFEDVLFQEEGE